MGPRSTDNGLDSGPCGTCLNLQSKLFASVAKEHGERWKMSWEDEMSAVRCTTFEDIEKSSTGGCKFCSILQDGIKKCWPLETDRNVHSTNNTTPWNDVGQPWNLCIEIRPERSLLLSRIDSRCVETIRTCEDYKPCWSSFCIFNSWRTPIEFFTLAGATPFHENFGPSGNVPATLTSDYVTQALQRWLSECNSEHSCCKVSDSVSESFCPKRLIQTTEGKVRLVELPPDSKVTYITLSHCWGPDPVNVVRTLEDNIASRRESIPWDEIPATFQDAINITRWLSLEYIWIDSLCIIQDNQNDWKELSVQMATVYSNSYLNIAATASKDSNGGLFASRELAVNPPSGTDMRSVESHALSGNVLARTHLHQAHKSFFRTSEPDPKTPHGSPFPLLQRAWVFQERMLSRRTVHFTRSEMVWECNEHTTCECGDYQDPEPEVVDGRRSAKMAFSGSTGDHEMSFYELKEVWDDSVATYSQLNISDPKDWPYAMEGLATRLVSYFKSDCVAGLWVGHFPHCLLWKPATDTEKSYHTSTREWPYHTYSFPSGPPTWSWFNYRAAIASGDGEIESANWLDTRSDEEADRDVKFEFGDAIEPAKGDQSAEFQVHRHGRQLYLTGLLQECHIRLPSPSPIPKVKLNLDDCEDSNAIRIWLDFEAPETLASARYPFYCLRISKEDNGAQESLVLAAFPGEDFYVRVGIGYSNTSEDPFKDAKVCRVEVR